MEKNYKRTDTTMNGQEFRYLLMKLEILTHGFYTIHAFLH